MPDYPYYTLRLKDGRTFSGMLGPDIRKTLDRRPASDMAQIVYEVRTKEGKTIKVWNDELEDVRAEIQTKRPQG